MLINSLIPQISLKRTAHVAVWGMMSGFHLWLQPSGYPQPSTSNGKNPVLRYPSHYLTEKNICFLILLSYTYNPPFSTQTDRITSTSKTLVTTRNVNVGGTLRTNVPKCVVIGVTNGNTALEQKTVADARACLKLCRSKNTAAGNMRSVWDTPSPNEYRIVLILFV